MTKIETKRLLDAVVGALDEKKGEDISILELDPSESGLTDYFVLVSGGNPRQVQTLADSVEMKLKQEFGQTANSREGYRQAEWVLLDYVDFVVHVFSEEKRAFYGIERLRKSARAVSPEELRAALSEKTVKARAGKGGEETGAGKAQAKGKKSPSVTKAKKAGSKAPSVTKAASSGKKAAGKKAVAKKAGAKKPVAKKAGGAGGKKAGAKKAGSKKAGSKMSGAKKHGAKKSAGTKAGKKGRG
jgi:ribosome-associated protein